MQSKNEDYKKPSNLGYVHQGDTTHSFQTGTMVMWYIVLNDFYMLVKMVNYDIVTVY